MVSRIRQGGVMINNSSGFTLIEFLVATVILMVGLLGLLQVINVAMEKNLETVFRNEAITLADDMMMEQRGKVFTALASEAKVGKTRNVRGIFKSYSAEVTVTNPSTNSRKISVDVTWKYKKLAKKHQVSSAVSQIQN